MVITISPRDASAGLSATFAPSCLRSSARLRVRLYTVTECPALSRLRAIPLPIFPRPMNPTFIFLLQSLSKTRPSTRLVGYTERRLKGTSSARSEYTSERAKRFARHGFADGVNPVHPAYPCYFKTEFHF